MNPVDLDREGIFKATPFVWKIQTSDRSQSVGLNIGFLILSQLDGDEWVSWAEADPHRVYGTFYVVGRDGKILSDKVKKLAEALGWRGDLESVERGGPPDRVVQITVKENLYEGKTTYRADWIEPENFVPKGRGADSAEVGALSQRFGSLLRAAAAAVAPKPGTKPPTKGAATAQPANGAKPAQSASRAAPPAAAPSKPSSVQAALEKPAPTPPHDDRTEGQFDDDIPSDAQPPD